jgi:hypothetical protein
MASGPCPECYERRDPTIKLFAVIAKGHPMPEVIAELLKPEGGSCTPLIGNVVGFLPPMDELLASSNLWASRRRFIEARIDLEVRAFYCPPLYFVQFTGRHWE